jgi:cytochrome c peroxidase
MTMTKLVTGLALVTALCACKKRDAPSSDPTAGSAAIESTHRPSQHPDSLPKMAPLRLPDDPKRADKVALGHVLFFDKRLSGNNDRSCYSCHQNEDGNGGHDAVAIGSGDKPLTRHSPVLWNVGYYQNAFYWDGRAATLEANTKGAWGGGNMGAGADNLDKKADQIAAIAGYKPLLEAAFGNEPIKADHVTSAISEYMRTMICNDTAYDRYAGGDRAAMSEQQQRGLDVFMIKGGCVTCHAPPFFSTAMGVDGGIYFNAGIATQGVPEDKVDVGRMAVTKDDGDWAKFKPPSLRNVTKSAPYFHDGSVAKLEDAVGLMASGGIKNKNLDSLFVDRKLSQSDLADLVAFMSALDCPNQLEPPAALP